MKPTHLNRIVPVSLLTLCVALSASCASTYKHSTGLKQVDGLVSRVERVHVEGELAMVAVRDSVTAMLELVAPQGQTTVQEAFETFEDSIGASVNKHKAFRLAVTELQSSATPFFEGWSAGLDSFTSQSIRIQSRKRMEETRASYDRIVLSSETPLARLEEFNTSLKDVALFLSRDFNSTSVRLIEGELRSLIQVAGDLDHEFSKCLVQCQGYSEASGLPNRVQVDVQKSTETEDTSK